MIRTFLSWALSVYRVERALRPFRDLADGNRVWERRRAMFERVAARWRMPHWQDAAALACQSAMPQHLSDLDAEIWLDNAASAHVDADREPWGAPR